MWLLRNNQKGLIYRVTSEKQHIVSRKDGDLLLQQDQSISRKHAQLSVINENEDNGIVVKDLGSKYGTFVITDNGELTQVTSNQQVILKSGDTVRFGVQWNCWQVEFVPLLVATSTLSQEEKAEVKHLVTELGGEVVSDWQDKCTHLTMNKITVTVKVVCALASCQPIVTPAYWRSFTQSLTSMQSTLPDCKDFLPPLAEAVLNPSEVSFTPNPTRCKLFKGYTFVASTTKQLSRMKPMITAAGGNTVEFHGKRWSEDRLLEDKTVLMQHSANKPGSQHSQVPDGYISVARKLRDKGVRCIPESEIGLSVIYCSTVQYCNPRYSATSVLGSNSPQATQPVTIICPNTEESVISNQDQNSVTNRPGPSINGVSKKRPLEDLSEGEEHPSKKPDRKENSEDLFGSQNLNENTQPNPTSNKMALRLKKTPSSNIQKEKVPAVAQSLDMFAPSGGKSNPDLNKSEVRPTCEDLFRSTGNKQPQTSNVDDNDEFSFIRNKKFKNVQKKEIQDEFSFISNNNSNRTHKRMADKEDEFSFQQNKRSCIPQGRVEDESDEFSFKSNKSSKIEPEGDSISYLSSKRPNKQNRLSNPDIFASGVESSFKSDSAAPPSKIRKSQDDDVFSFGEEKQESSKENLFDFPGDKQNRKCRRTAKCVLNSNDETEIKIALFSKQEEAVPGPSGLQSRRSLNEIEDPPEAENLVTYSKLLPMPVIDKEKVDDEEVDELAKELHNATVVVVKPLLAPKKKNPVNVSTAVSGKNFKKFHKVHGLNKRIVPHIIGGSDLIPHYRVNQPSDDQQLLLPPSPQSPQQQTPHDEWSFLRNKKLGNVH